MEKSALRAKTAAALDVSGFALAATVLVATLLRLGVSTREGIVGGAVLSLSILPLGYRLLRGLALHPGERFVVAALVGFPGSAAAYYLLSRLGAPGGFPLLVVGLLLEAGVRLARIPSQGEVSNEDRERKPSGPPVALVALILLCALYDRRPFDQDADGLSYRYIQRDELFNIGFYSELLRAVPPRQYPQASGISFPNYHTLSYLPGVWLARFGRIPIPTIHHAFAPMLFIALFCGGVYLALRTRLPPTVAAASLALLFFVSKGFSTVAPGLAVRQSSTALSLFLVSESVSAGLVAIATVLSLLALYDREREAGRASLRLLLLSALVVGLTFSLKAQVFLFLFPAYVLALGVLSLVRKAPELLWGVLVSLATTMLLVASWPVPRHLGGMTFAPGHLAGELGLLGTFSWLPRSLGGLAAGALATWKLLNHPLLLPGYLASRIGNLRRARALEITLVLALLGSLLMVCGLMVPDPYGVPTTRPIRQAADGLWPIATLGEAAVLGGLLQRRFAWAGRLFLAAVLALGACRVGVLLPRMRLGIRISPGEARALAFLRERTSESAVVIHARDDAMDPEWSEASVNWRPIVSAFSGRRCVLEYFEAGIDPAHNRQKDTRRLFRTKDQAEGEAILQRYHVDYVLQFRRQPLLFSSPAVRVAFDGGDASVSQVVGLEGGSGSR
jgi:hypothetical protein